VCVCVCVCVSTHLPPARQRCCPPPRSAGTHPGLRGQTCPSGPSAPACPRSPPSTTCFLLALHTTRDGKTWGGGGGGGGGGPQQESRNTGTSRSDVQWGSKWHIEAGWHLKWVSLCTQHTYWVDLTVQWLRHRMDGQASLEVRWTWRRRATSSEGLVHMYPNALYILICRYVNLKK